MTPEVGHNDVMSRKDFVDPENVLREVRDRELARLEAQYAGRRSVRDRFRLLRGKRRAIRAHGQGRWCANW